MLKSFYIINKSTCTRVKLYGEDIRNLFIINNIQESKNIEKANYIIINTCSFLKTKEEYFMNYIKELISKLNNKQKLIVIGCLPSIRKEDILNAYYDSENSLKKIREGKSQENTLITDKSISIPKNHSN